MAIVNEVVTAFTFQGSLKPLDDFRGKTKAAIGYAKGFALAATAAAAAIGTFVTVTLNGADAQNHLAKSTGVSIESLQTLGYAASVSGSTAQALEGTIANLSRKIGEASVKGSEDLQRLGLSVRDANGQVKTADALLLEIGRKFKAQGLSLQEQASYAEALGIDSSLLQLLNKTSGEISALQKNALALGVVTQKQARGIEKYNDSITTMNFGFKALGRELAVSLSPSLEKLAKKFTDFMIKDGEKIRESISKTTEFLGRVFDAFVRIGGAINETIGWKPILIGIGAWLAIAFWPITLAIAGVSALIALVDDLIVAFSGGKSFIQDFFNEFLGFDLVGTMRQWSAYIVKFIDSIIEGFGIVSDLFGSIKSFFGGSSVDINASQNVIPTTIPITQGASNSSSVSNSVSQDVKINIASSDPLLAGQNVEAAISRVMTDAQDQIGRGGR